MAIFFSFSFSTKIKICFAANWNERDKKDLLMRDLRFKKRVAIGNRFYLGPAHLLNKAHANSEADVSIYRNFFIVACMFSISLINLNILKKKRNIHNT